MNAHGTGWRQWTKAGAGGGLSLMLLLGTLGCVHRKVKAVVLPQATVPVSVDNPSDSADLPMIEPKPVPEGPVPTAEAASKPKRERRKPAKAAPVVPPPAAPNPTAATEDASAIGALTAGGDSSPQKLQEAADLIASNEKRLKALPDSVVNAQRSQVSTIRNFQRQAQEALNSGDLEGAKTLATKAKLLLYDLDRVSGS